MGNISHIWSVKTESIDSTPPMSFEIISKHFPTFAIVADAFEEFRERRSGKLYESYWSLPRPRPISAAGQSAWYVTNITRRQAFTYKELD